ncbi:MAG: hypothetical protein LBG83_05625 [Oscillospiraceae bacterium]|jgi:hypothetical protein|nr:hypothetical protein [Oscillospiraceae bacterium]
MFSEEFKALMGEIDIIRTIVELVVWVGTVLLLKFGKPLLFKIKYLFRKKRPGGLLLIVYRKKNVPEEFERYRKANGLHFRDTVSQDLGAEQYDKCKMDDLANDVWKRLEEAMKKAETSDVHVVIDASWIIASILLAKLYNGPTVHLYQHMPNPKSDKDSYESWGTLRRQGK